MGASQRGGFFCFAFRLAFQQLSPPCLLWMHLPWWLLVVVKRYVGGGVRRHKRRNLQPGVGHSSAGHSCKRDRDTEVSQEREQYL